MKPQHRQAELALVEAGELAPAETAALYCRLTPGLSVKPREARWAHIRAKLAEATAPTIGRSNVGGERPSLELRPRVTT